MSLESFKKKKGIRSWETWLSQYVHENPHLKYTEKVQHCSVHQRWEGEQVELWGLSGQPECQMRKTQARGKSCPKNQTKKSVTAITERREAGETACHILPEDLSSLLRIR